MLTTLIRSSKLLVDAVDGEVLDGVGVVSGGLAVGDDVGSHDGAEQNSKDVLQGVHEVPANHKIMFHFS